MERPPLSPAATTGAPVGPLATDGAAVAVGVALLVATVLLSAFRTRAEGDLDWSNLILGLAAALGLLGVAVAARMLVADPLRAGNLFAWPGAFGALALGVMLAVWVDEDWVAYLSGLLIVVLSVAGYLLSRRPAFVVTAVIGLLVVYLKLTDDLFDVADVDQLDDNAGVVVGAVLLAFTLLVTAGGWFLPTRVYSGVVAGAIAVVGYASTLVGLVVAATFARAFSGFGEEPPQRPAGFDDDVWWIFGFSIVLIALWAFCTWVTGHAGFRLLMVALAAAVVPLGTTALAVEHPTWWEVVLGLVGGGLLVAVALRAMRGRGAGQRHPAGRPLAPPDGPPAAPPRNSPDLI